MNKEYTLLFNAITDAIEILKMAQADAMHVYLERMVREDTMSYEHMLLSDAITTVIEKLMIAQVSAEDKYLQRTDIVQVTTE